MYNISKFLEENNIPNWSKGNNVSEGWYNIQCIFCDDTSNHLGINPSGGYHCWKCGARGSFYFLIKNLLKTTIEKARDISIKYANPQFIETEEPIPIKNDFELPKANEWTDAHLYYLTSRGFSLDIIDKYKLYPTIYTKGWEYRIIAPIIYKGQIVSYTGRSIIPNQIKYKTCHNNDGIIPAKHLLYNIDTVYDKCLIVEGVTDVWKMGDGVIATLGIEYTTEQLLLLKEKKLDYAYIMYDGEPLAIKKAYQLANELSLFIPNVEVLELDSNDPGSLPPDEITSIRKDLRL